MCCELRRNKLIRNFNQKTKNLESLTRNEHVEVDFLRENSISYFGNGEAQFSNNFFFIKMNSNLFRWVVVYYYVVVCMLKKKRELMRENVVGVFLGQLPLCALRLKICNLFRVDHFAIHTCSNNEDHAS